MTVKLGVSREKRLTVKLGESLIQCYAMTDEDLFPNIKLLLQLGCTSPIGSYETERSFSALRRIETHLRSTMCEERLSALTLMTINYSETCLVSPSEIVKKFVAEYPRKLFCNSILYDNVRDTNKANTLNRKTLGLCLHMHDMSLNTNLMI